ncbi:hypothetical protein DFS34DRAFT_609306 [Phlyctochytrium arcticum]|nr:hypothetical protein DFS34DRAFT_609306 [Phlyctochytrium arcticum]
MLACRRPATLPRFSSRLSSNPTCTSRSSPYLPLFPTTSTSTTFHSAHQFTSIRHASQQHQPNFYQNRILEQYASQETKRVTLRQLTVFGRTLTEDKLLKSANYVRAELPVRLAHRIFDFQHLPFIVGTNPHIEHIYRLYWEAFETFRSIPHITNLEQNREFCDTVERMLDAHLVAIPRLAMGIAESGLHLNPKEADRFMNEMLRSRIGRRVLAEQHITLSAVFDGRDHQEPHFIGIVNTQCRAQDVLQRCAHLAGQIFEEAFQVTPPEIIIDGHLDATFTYIPDQIEYIIFELLKNSMWATIEKHAPETFDQHVVQEQDRRRVQAAAVVPDEQEVYPQPPKHDDDIPPAHVPDFEKDVAPTNYGEAWDANAALRAVRAPPAHDPMSPTLEQHNLSTGLSTPSYSFLDTDGTSPSSPADTDSNSSTASPALPPIRATIGAADSLITFRLSDQGGGIHKDIQAHLWSYSHPSKQKFLNFAHVPRLAAKVEESAHHVVPTNLKLGLGLPMSKVYANYWGGEIEVCSMEGYGTDAYVTLKVGNQVENLTYSG